MVGIGIALCGIGICMYIYGNQMNNDIELQMESLFGSGSVNPGSNYMTIGIVIAVIGLLLVVIGVYKYFSVNKNSPDRPNYLKESTWLCVCGTSNPISATFCASCGRRKGAITSDVQDSGWTCFCGASNHDANKFCESCGKRRNIKNSSNELI
jgi:uncharacterized membrane protein YidH (DUF202 family)